MVGLIRTEVQRIGKSISSMSERGNAYAFLLRKKIIGNDLLNQQPTRESRCVALIFVIVAGAPHVDIYLEELLIRQS